jgi:hypothetical protein
MPRNHPNMGQERGAFRRRLRRPGRSQTPKRASARSNQKAIMTVDLRRWFFAIFYIFCSGLASRWRHRESNGANLASAGLPIHTTDNASGIKKRLERLCFGLRHWLNLNGAPMAQWGFRQRCLRPKEKPMAQWPLHWVFPSGAPMAQLRTGGFRQFYERLERRDMLIVEADRQEPLVVLCKIQSRQRGIGIRCGWGNAVARSHARFAWACERSSGSPARSTRVQVGWRA